jgi:hypothetical protein
MEFILVQPLTIMTSERTLNCTRVKINFEKDNLKPANLPLANSKTEKVN